MWNVKTNVTPVIKRATETISKSFRKLLSNINGKARNQGTTENSHTGHGTHTSESTDVTIQNSRFNSGTSVICTMNSNCRTAATLYSLGTWFFSGM
jgi:hypothetical protein